MVSAGMEIASSEVLPIETPSARIVIELEDRSGAVAGSDGARERHARNRETGGGFGGESCPR
jgi:hypothetical protein